MTRRQFEVGAAVHKDMGKVKSASGTEGSKPICNSNIVLDETIPAQAAKHWRNVTCKRCLRSKK